jgi:23S rRNA pseudouridine1911/1915/1917 synthase
MIKVSERQSGKRLDTFLIEHLESAGKNVLSRNFLKNNWGSLIKVNGEFPKPSYKLRVGDVVNIEMDYIEKLKNNLNCSSNINPQSGKLDVLFEDKDFLVVNKPKGVVVHPGLGNRENTLAAIVKGYLLSKEEFDDSVSRAGLVHRLDKGVSGVMVFAKTLESQKHLQEQFEQHKARKIYLANVEYTELRPEIKEFFPEIKLDIKKEVKILQSKKFSFDNTWFRSEGYIKRSSRNRVKMEFKSYQDGHSKKAITYFKPVSKDKVLVSIETGRMHQIRATFEYLGISIKGDTLYGKSQKSGIMPEKIELESILLSFKDLSGKDLTITKF